MAEDLDEVDAAAHLGLLLFGVLGCRDRFTERGRRWPSLTDLTAAARGRLGGFDSEYSRRLEAKVREDTEAATAARRANRRASWRDREDRIERLGITNAVPARAGPRRP